MTDGTSPRFRRQLQILALDTKRRFRPSLSRLREVHSVCLCVRVPLAILVGAVLGRLEHAAAAAEEEKSEDDGHPLTGHENLLFFLPLYLCQV